MTPELSLAPPEAFGNRIRLGFPPWAAVTRAIVLAADGKVALKAGGQSRPVMRKQSVGILSAGVGLDHGRRENAFPNGMGRAVATERIECHCSRPAGEPARPAEWRRDARSGWKAAGGVAQTCDL